MSDTYANYYIDIKHEVHYGATLRRLRDEAKRQMDWWTESWTNVREHWDSTKNHIEYWTEVYAALELAVKKYDEGGLAQAPERPV